MHVILPDPVLQFFAEFESGHRRTGLMVAHVAVARFESRRRTLRTVGRHDRTTFVEKHVSAVRFFETEIHKLVRNAVVGLALQHIPSVLIFNSRCDRICQPSFLHQSTRPLFD
jgi:hypothetical protein